MNLTTSKGQILVNPRAIMTAEPHGHATKGATMIKLFDGSRFLVKENSRDVIELWRLHMEVTKPGSIADVRKDQNPEAGFLAGYLQGVCQELGAKFGTPGQFAQQEQWMREKMIEAVRRLQKLIEDQECVNL
jgi:hypothetical protein